MNFLHDGAAGDLIYALIAVKKAGGGKVWMPETTARWVETRPLKNEFYENCRRLVEHQPYVTGVGKAEELAGEEVLDFSPFRSRLHGNLAEAQCRWIGVEFPGFEPWLTVEPLDLFGGEEFVVMNRSQRYRTALDWKAVVERETRRKVFVGFADEWEGFPQAGVTWVETKDLYDVARLIAGSAAFYGNASSALVIAQGLGKERFVEFGPTSCMTEMPCEHALR